MKIINGSPALIGMENISVSSEGIRVGTDQRTAGPAGIVTIGIMCALWLPGPGVLYFILSVILGLVWLFQVKDDRKLYTPKQIKQIQVLGYDRVSSKGTAGSLGGAAVGGVLFGGAGAVVGAVAAGNNVKGFSNVAIKFSNKEWIVVEASDDTTGKREYVELLKMAGDTNHCPI